jgi:hypothetical protein
VSAEIDRAVEGGFLADPNALIDLGDDRAADGTVRADVLDLPELPRRRTCGLGFRRLDHSGGQARRQRGSSGGDPRSPEEGTPVDRSAEDARERG